MSNFKTMAIASIIAIVAVISAVAVAAQADTAGEDELKEYTFFIDLGGTILSYADYGEDSIVDYGDGSIEVVKASNVKDAFTLACEQKYGYEGAVTFADEGGLVAEINGVNANGIIIWPDESFGVEDYYNHLIYLYPIQFVYDGNEWKPTSAPLGCYDGDETTFAIVTMPTSFGDDEYFTFDDNNGMYYEEGRADEVYQYFQDVYGWTAGYTSEPVFRVPFIFTKDGLIYEVQENFSDVKVVGATADLTGDIIIPDTVTFADTDFNVWRIGLKAFMDRDDITSVNVNCDIERHAFYKCDGLEAVILGDGCEQIGKSAFAYCPSLSLVSMTGNVYYIGVNAFYGAHFYDENGEAVKANVENLAGYTYIGEGAELYKYVTYEYDIYIDLGGEIYNIIADEYPIVDYGGPSWESVEAPDITTALTYACNQKFGEGSLELSSSGAITSINGMDGNGLYVFPDEAFNDTFDHWIFFYPVQFVLEDDGWQQLSTYIGAYDGESTTFAIVLMPVSFETEPIEYHFDQYNGMYSVPYYGDKVYKMFQDVYGWTYGSPSEPVFRDIDVFELYYYLYQVSDIEDKEVKVIGSVNPEGEIYIADTVEFRDEQYTVTRVGMKAFMDCDDITSLVVNCDIERHAFYKCDGLETITIQDGCQQIGKSAFAYCPSLTSVAMSDSVYYLGVNAFYGSKFHDENGESLKANVQNLAGYKYIGENSDLYRVTYTFYIDLGGYISGFFLGTDENYGGPSTQIVCADNAKNALTKACEQKFGPGSIVYKQTRYGYSIQSINGMDGSGSGISSLENQYPPYPDVYYYPVQYVFEDTWKQASVTIPNYTGPATTFAITFQPITFDEEPIEHTFADDNDRYVYEALMDTYNWPGWGTFETPFISTQGVSASFKENLALGDAATVEVTIDPFDSTNPNVFFYSTDTNVATVDRTGVVTAVGVGSAEIVVMSWYDPELSVSLNVNVFSEFISDNFVFEIMSFEDKTVKVIGYDGIPSGELFIPEIALIEDYEFSVARVGMKAFMDCDEITTVVVNCDIERHAFYKCDELENVILQEGCKQIGKSAFAYCTDMEFIDFNDQITYIGVNAFYGIKFLDQDGNRLAANVDNLAGNCFEGDDGVLTICPPVNRPS